jgi:aquaporin Z
MTRSRLVPRVDLEASVNGHARTPGSGSRRGLTAQARAALAAHWPEYVIEGACLGLFMLSACVFATLLEHPDSPVRRGVDASWLRRIPMGLAMGATAAALIYSRWGRRSGAHMNPATTLTFWRLGKVAGWDAVFYGIGQFAGGVAGVAAAAWLLGDRVAHPAVGFAATVPGPWGPGIAFQAEVALTFGLMATILTVSNRPRVAHLTGLSAAVLVATYIVVEAPLSGMSMNPARTLGSAVFAQAWTGLWIYFGAPTIGMLLAAEWYRRRTGAGGVRCAKLHHDTIQRCIFRCGYREAAGFGGGA